MMKPSQKKIDVFKMKNRQGYAAICDGHVTEGTTRQQAIERMAKALSRTQRLGNRKS
jgi:hypothetical protein